MKRVKTMSKVGIIAGNGALPRCLIEACEAANYPYCVVALKGHAEASSFPDTVDVKWVRPGAVAATVRFFRRQNVTDIVFIGGVRRPSLIEIMPDWLALKLLIRIRAQMRGDDSLLRAIVAETEKLGFRVKGVHEIMPELVVRTGIYGVVTPTAADNADIARGFQVAKLLGQADVGQAVIVQQGLVLAVEGIEGTAALIERSAGLKRKGGGGVLVKVAKPQQDRRVDLPTIGPDTVTAVAKAGFRGIAVEAGAALIVEAEKTVALADKAGIFIIGIQGEK